MIFFAKPLQEGQFKVISGQNLSISKQGKYLSYTNLEKDSNLFSQKSFTHELEIFGLEGRLTKFSVTMYPFEFVDVTCLENQVGTFVKQDGELWDPKSTRPAVVEVYETIRPFGEDEEHSMEETAEPVSEDLSPDETPETETESPEIANETCAFPEFTNCICDNGIAISKCNTSAKHQCISCHPGFGLSFENDTYICQPADTAAINCESASVNTTLPEIPTTEIENYVEILSDQRPLEDTQCWSGTFKYNIIYLSHGIHWSAALFLNDIKTVIDQGYNIIVIGFYLAAWWPQPIDAHYTWSNLEASDRQKILNYAHSKGAKILLSIGGDQDTIDDIGGPIETEKGQLYGQIAAKAVLDGDFDGIDFNLHLKEGNSWYFQTGKMQKFLQDALRESRKYLKKGHKLVTFTAIGPYLSKWASTSGQDDRGYFQFMIDNQFNIDYLAIQYWDQGTYLDFKSIFESSYYFQGSAIKTLIDAGIHPEKLVVGKPIGSETSRNGYIAPQMLSEWACLAYNYDEILGFRGGFMTWMYDKNHLGRSEYWARHLNQFCQGLPKPKNLCRDIKSEVDLQLDEIDDTMIVEEIDKLENQISVNNDGFTCNKIGKISKTTKGWKANDGDGWTWVSQVEYEIPEEQIGEYYLLVEFSAPVRKIDWWQWEDERPPESFNQENTVWKLKGQDDWWIGKDLIQFEMHPTTVRSGKTAGESYHYCWKPCLDCHYMPEIPVSDGGQNNLEQVSVDIPDLSEDWKFEYPEDNIGEIVL